MFAEVSQLLNRLHMHLKKRMVINVAHLSNFVSLKIEYFHFYLWLIVIQFICNNSVCSPEVTHHTKIFTEVNIILTYLTLRQLVFQVSVCRQLPELSRRL